jgi:hypothetical protein
MSDVLRNTLRGDKTVPEIDPPVNIADLVDARARRDGDYLCSASHRDARRAIVTAMRAFAPEQPKRKQRRRLSERDIARTITAHLKSGLGVARTETDPATGRFVVIAGAPEQTEIAPTSSANEWDQVFDDQH